MRWHLSTQLRAIGILLRCPQRQPRLPGDGLPIASSVASAQHRASGTASNGPPPPPGGVIRPGAGGEGPCPVVRQRGAAGATDDRVSLNRQRPPAEGRHTPITRRTGTTTAISHPDQRASGEHSPLALLPYPTAGTGPRVAISQQKLAGYESRTGQQRSPKALSQTGH